MISFPPGPMGRQFMMGGRKWSYFEIDYHILIDGIVLLTAGWASNIISPGIDHTNRLQPISVFVGAELYLTHIMWQVT